GSSGGARPSGHPGRAAGGRWWRRFEPGRSPAHSTETVAEGANRYGSRPCRGGPEGPPLTLSDTPFHGAGSREVPMTATSLSLEDLLRPGYVRGTAVRDNAGAWRWSVRRHLVPVRDRLLREHPDRREAWLSAR